MSVESTSAAFSPVHIEEPKAAKVIGKLEQKITGAIAPAFGGILPETPASLLSQRAIIPLSSNIVPKGYSAEYVAQLLDSILDEKGISKTAALGAETIAAQRLHHDINMLLDVGGYPSLKFNYEVRSVNGINIIFSSEGVTLAGIEKEEWPQFFDSIRKSDSELAAKLDSYQVTNKIVCVSKKVTLESEHIADDRFTGIATTFQQQLEASEQSEATEPKVSDENKEEEMSWRAVRVSLTYNSVEAAQIYDVASTVLMIGTAVKILEQQRRLEHHIQEKSALRKEEERERQKEETQKKELQHEILAEDIKHYEEERSVEKVAQRKHELADTSVHLESGKKEYGHEIGEYVEKLKSGEPTSAPDMPKK